MKDQTTFTSRDGPPSPTNYRRQELLEQHYPLVRSVVGNMMSYLPSCADAEELHSAGVVGLVSAVDRYDRSKKETFEAYAALRIRGAILDELRRIDLLPRTTRQKTRRLSDTRTQLEQKLGREPTEAEVARAMEMTPAEFRKYQFKARPVMVMSLDGPADERDDDGGGFHDTLPLPQRRDTPQEVEDNELIGLAMDELKKLPQRHQKILAMYYFEGMRLAEIAEVYGVTEARICQIHKQALAKIRKSLPA